VSSLQTASQAMVSAKSRTVRACVCCHDRHDAGRRLDSYKALALGDTGAGLTRTGHRPRWVSINCQPSQVPRMYVIADQRRSRQRRTGRGALCTLLKLQ